MWVEVDLIFASLLVVIVGASVVRWGGLSMPLAVGTESDGRIYITLRQELGITIIIIVK